MKKGIAILLTLVFISQIIAKIAVISYYHANKTYIANTLCINKSNPRSCCEGSCFLNDKLSKTEEPATKKLPTTIKDINEIVTVLEVYKSIDFKFSIPLTIHFTDYKNLYNYLSFSSVFHPPNLLFV